MADLHLIALITSEERERAGFFTDPEADVTGSPSRLRFKDDDAAKLRPIELYTPIEPVGGTCRALRDNMRLGETEAHESAAPRHVIRTRATGSTGEVTFDHRIARGARQLFRPNLTACNLEPNRTIWHWHAGRGQERRR